MRLNREPRIRPRPKARELVGESEPAQKFFDYRTDVPQFIKTYIADDMRTPFNSLTDFTVVLYGELAAAGIERFKISERGLREQVSKLVKELYKLMQGDDDISELDPVDYERFLVLVQLSSFLPSVPTHVESFFKKNQQVFEPGRFNYSALDERKITLIYAGFLLFPEFREQYRQIVKERLQELPKIISQMRSAEGALRTLAHIFVIYPESAQQVKSLALPFRASWLSRLINDYYDIELFPLLSLAILGDEQVTLDDRGRLVFTSTQAPMETTPPLPERQAL